MRILSLLEQLGRPKEENDACKGIFFRCRVNDFYSNTGGLTLMHRVSFRMLKKMSCPGCIRCGQLIEDIASTGLENIELPKQPKNGAVYQAVIHVGSPDWETGFIEEWDWSLEEHTPN